MTEFYGHKNLLITEHKVGQSCTLFSKARVWQNFFKIPNAAFLHVPLSLKVWSQSPLVRAVGSEACTPSVASFTTS